MSRSKPNKVFAIVDESSVVKGLIARYGKGALRIARNHGVHGAGYTAREAASELAKVAINKAETK